ncbi:hypothetical protein [Natrarchaeobaculum aegyptiacum]|uniref:Uncharacterized protein n=1 Tax=Natrarchaeobaculum aegyptiacum TaxID=745377 RepID=A0A2Z2HNM7_9EURY|nr:hypothetical protein [Natrarchaeobaculum aegyptiacum]ARS88492.1 hypothetical protein B1756_01140 [Natrarchaeobaculum aegyptiacum]
MKFKPVPEPPDALEGLERVVHTVPARSVAVDDCCAHLVAKTDLETREEAAAWLTFLRALELVDEGREGYYRLEGASSSDGVDDRGTDVARCRRAFVDRVYGVEAVLAALEAVGKPLSASELADGVDDRLVSDRSGSGERLVRLLEWAVLFDLVERDGDRYDVA